MRLKTFILLISMMLFIMLFAELIPAGAASISPDVVRAAQQETAEITIPDAATATPTMTVALPTDEPTRSAPADIGERSNEEISAITPTQIAEAETAIQPGWLPRKSDGHQELAKYGFTATNLEYISGNKGGYFWNIPYNTILAAVVPEENRLLKKQNFERWKDPNALAAQGLDLSLIPGIKDEELINPDSYHPNLCGSLTVASVIGMDPAYFIWQTFDAFSWSRNFYRSGEIGTYRENLVDLFRFYGWTAEYPQEPASSYSCTGSPLSTGQYDQVGREAICQMATWLNDGNVILIGTNLMADSRHGVLISRAYNFAGATNAAHWAAVLQIVPSQDGFTYFRVYNSYQNREEWYTSVDFYAAWQLGDNSLKDIVLAHP